MNWRGDREAAKSEPMDAINHLSAAIITIREGRG